MTCGCGRVNDARRRYCGSCGKNLQPTCGRCGFGNDREDRYCGGCGDLLTAGAPAPVVIAAAPPVAPPSPVAVTFTPSELAALLAPVAAPAPVDTIALPDGSIGQDDLDRLFGGS